MNNIIYIMILANKFNLRINFNVIKVLIIHIHITIFICIVNLIMACVYCPPAEATVEVTSESIMATQE